MYRYSISTEDELTLPHHQNQPPVTQRATGNTPQHTGTNHGIIQRVLSAKSSSGVQSSVVQRLTDAEIAAKYDEDKANMNKVQKAVIRDIVSIDGWQAFRGGHVAVNGKELFLKWRTAGGKGTAVSDKATARGDGIGKGSLGSSHYPGGGKQYEIRLPHSFLGNNWGTVLFGLRTDPATGAQQSWFQVEGHSGTLGDSKIRFLTDVIMHGADFLAHKRYFSGNPVVNVGPFGTDPASEKTGTERIY